MGQMLHFERWLTMLEVPLIADNLSNGARTSNSRSRISINRMLGC